MAKAAQIKTRLPAATGSGAACGGFFSVNRVLELMPAVHLHYSVGELDAGVGDGRALDIAQRHGRAFPAPVSCTRWLGLLVFEAIRVRHAGRGLARVP